MATQWYCTPYITEYIGVNCSLLSVFCFVAFGFCSLVTLFPQVVHVPPGMCKKEKKKKDLGISYKKKIPVKCQFPPTSSALKCNRREGQTLTFPWLSVRAYNDLNTRASALGFTLFVFIWSSLTSHGLLHTLWNPSVCSFFFFSLSQTQLWSKKGNHVKH